MRILVTGGCGFIGSNLVEYHLKKEDEVLVVDNLSTGTLENISAFKNDRHFKFEQADVLTWDNLGSAIFWADRIYHMSAVVGIFRVISEPVNVLNNNIHCTQKILELAAQKKLPPRIMVASSSSVYGLSVEKKMDENCKLILPNPHHSIYGYCISKITEEALGLAYHKEFNLPITPVRLFNTTGPRQTGSYGMVVPRFVQQACLGEPITVFGDGTQTRSFCDVRDVVVALDRLADNEAAIGEIVNVGKDGETSINDLAQLVKSKANSLSEIKHIPYKEAYGTELVDVCKRRPDISKLLQLTGLKHQWTLDDTISDLIKSFLLKN